MNINAYMLFRYNCYYLVSYTSPLNSACINTSSKINTYYKLATCPGFVRVQFTNFRITNTTKKLPIRSSRSRVILFHLCILIYFNSPLFQFNFESDFERRAVSFSFIYPYKSRPPRVRSLRLMNTP